MRIVFFGTSHGIPEPNKKCSSALVEVGGKRYIIDMGTNAAEQLITRGMRLESINAIFITHMHGDHTDGLIPFLDLCSWAFRDADPAIFVPANVEAVSNAINAWLVCTCLSKLRKFDYRTVHTGEIFDDGNIKVTAYRTKHCAESYAYLIEAEGKRVLFSGDMSYQVGPSDFPTEVLDLPLDLAICECAHFTADKYLPIFEGNKNLKRLCFNHFSERLAPSVIAIKDRLPELGVFLAQDGMEISL